MSHLMTALAMRQEGLKPAAKIVLYWLADHHNSETGLCCPSLSVLARECEADKATVSRHLSALEAAGFITRNRRNRPNGSQTSTSYLLNLKPVADCNSPVAKRDTPCRKMQSTPVANCDAHNLGNINLGMEPSIICQKTTFDDFWAIVPRKVARANAEKAWAKAIKKASPEKIISAMVDYAESRASEDATYTAHPASWLNAERWDDDLPPQQKPKTDDFHAQFSNMLGGPADGLQSENALDRQRTERISAPLQEARPPR